MEKSAYDYCRCFAVQSMRSAAPLCHRLCGERTCRSCRRPWYRENLAQPLNGADAQTSEWWRLECAQGGFVGCRLRNTAGTASTLAHSSALRANRTAGRGITSRQMKLTPTNEMDSALRCDSKRWPGHLPRRIACRAGLLVLVVSCRAVTYRKMPVAQYSRM